jgi:hypothetical protein
LSQLLGGGCGDFVGNLLGVGTKGSIMELIKNVLRVINFRRQGKLYRFCGAGEWRDKGGGQSAEQD